MTQIATAKIRAFLKKPLVLIGGILIIGGIILFSGNGKAEAEITTVERGTVIETIAATGKTKSKTAADLAFDRSGQVSRVYARVGDRVHAGQILVELERSELAANLADAEANAEIQRAKLAELSAGSSPQTIQLKQAAAAKAESLKATALQNLSEKNHDAYIKADTAIRNYIDQFISNGSSANPSLTLPIANQFLETEIKVGRIRAEILLLDWYAYLQNPQHTAEESAMLSSTYLAELKAFLDIVALAVNALTSTSGLSQTTIDAYKTDVASARTDINAASQNISSALEKLNVIKGDIAIAKQELAVSITGGTAEQIQTQEAYVRQAEAKIKGVQAQIGKAMLRAPFAGIVTKQDAEAGETVSASQVITSIAGEGGYEIEVFMPEINIGKVAEENPVRITLDAFPGEIFVGRVLFIDPAETVVDGIVNFKVTILLEPAEIALKSGLTANLDIETARAEEVLFLPRAAVRKSGDGAFVTRVNGENTEEIPVTLGLAGEQSRIEILSGVAEGDRILIVPAL